MAAAEDGRVRPEPSAVLNWLPVAVLILADDGTLVEANRAWAALSAGLPQAARDDGWLGILSPVDRAALGRMLRKAAADGGRGSADAWLASGEPARRSRWWWRPGRSGQLVVCVADLDGYDLRQAGEARGAPDASGPDRMLDVLSLVVHRLFGIGLEIQSAVGRADGPVADLLQLVVDELDDLIRDARSMAFGLQADAPGGRPSGC